MSSEFDFDPNAMIDAPAEGSVADFANLIDTAVTGDDEAARARIAEELKSGSFGSVDVKDFTAFNAHDIVVTEGQYAFAVQQRHLKEATTITRFTTMVSKGGFGAVKLTIYEDRLRLSTFNQAAFAEVFIPLEKKAENVSGGHEVSFIFDQNVLAKIAQSFVDAIIQFTYDAERSLLTITSGKTQLQLSTYAKIEFIDFHAKLGTPRYVAPLPTDTLRKAIGYSSLFVRKDDLQLNMSLLDVRDASVIGGNYASIGVFQTEEFSGLDFRVKYEIIKALEASLPRFDAANTHLFETDTFYIIRDANLYFGFEKTQSKFPAIAKFFELTAPDHVLIPRVQLLNALYKLSVVSVDRELLVRVQVEGAGTEAHLSLQTKDATGKTSRDDLAIVRNANGVSTYEPIDLYVNINAFIKVVSHFESANVQLEVLARKALVIKDEHEKEWQATTFLSALSEEAVAQQKAKREDAKAA